MLSQEENDLLTRVGPGTTLGALMRQYWIPALLATELPAVDGAPVRVRLLGEDLIAFRASSGTVGLIQNACMHRGASLFFGRNEEDGLRCVYHGWKYDVSGQCVDMPNEPAFRWTDSSGRDSTEASDFEAQAEATSGFKEKIKAAAYPCIERGGVIWAYMGPRSDPPPLPDLEPNMLPEGQWAVTATMRECNYFQALEGDIDTCHSPFLHSGHDRVEDTRPGTFQRYRVITRAPHYATTDTDFGTMYGAYVPAEEDSQYWRIACYLFPFYVIIPTGRLGQQVLVRAWVPIDDTHTMFFYMSKRGSIGRPGDGDGESRSEWLEPNTSDWYGRFRLSPDLRNDYFIDREKQYQMVSFTGIDGVPIQDKAVTESMGPIYDRRNEHLGSSDAMLMRTRKRLLTAANELQERSVTPPGVDHPEVYRVRAGGVILPKRADWLEATAELRQAFADRPLDPALYGGGLGYRSES